MNGFYFASIGVAVLLLNGFICLCKECKRIPLEEFKDKYKEL